ncbi:MAG: carotenoid oxygenase family protein [Cyclobacteriaceae bacterium]|nr:carotenoid oxygenase family protein [Cyclobacteriaceae bacterium]
MPKRDFSTASRKEINIKLNIMEGSMPTDIFGIVFINSACGTVNSNGLPFKPNNPDGSQNQEYGSPLINGDGMMIRVDFTQPGEVIVKTGILKPPCYYADLATSPQLNPGNEWQDLAFHNMGLARIAMKMGTRNELNTAITPVKFNKDNAHRLLATFDAGRPFEFDPQHLNLLTAIGENKIWHSGLPPFLKQPLAMILTTAHPVFDPYTQELFTVNFTKSNKQLMKATHIFDVMFKDADWFKKEFNKLIGWLEGKSLQEQIKHTQRFLGTIHLRSPKNKNLWNWIKYKWMQFYHRDISNENGVKVLRWMGTKVLDEWSIVDEKGNGIAIDYNMHQISLSRDYLILCDTNFKFTLDVMINFPFQHEPMIDKFIRSLLSGVMNDFSTLYLVPRASLVPGAKNVIATTVHLPVETVHFSANYDNPNNTITLHTAHNCSACPAEWLRSYDTLVAAPNKSVNLEKLGLIAIGEMDIGKIGKIVINAKSGSVVEPETKYLQLTGESDGKIDGPHTWAVGLYTYRDMLSSDTNVAKIKNVFWQSYGLRDDSLTTYVYDLYKDPKRSRTYSAEEMLKFTQMGARFVLQCVETDNMEVTDFYTFDKEQYFWSLQFIPKSKAQSEIDDSLNGYILTTVITGAPFGIDQYDYTCELWLFDANNLSAGPVCKLAHPDLSFGFTIHSVWVAEAITVPAPEYALDVVEDYNYMIQIASTKDRLRQRIQSLFDQKVYPHFK